MVTRSALTLVDAIAEETARLGAASADAALRSQAAFVRAIADEVGRRHPGERSVAPLHAQLGEELSRLAQLAKGDASEAAAPGRMEVLVVEDDELTLRAMASLLRDLGHPCRTASNAEEALAEYERCPADIVISDWNLGVMSGLELCQILKQRNPHAYVILVTGRSDTSLLDGVQGGVDDFLRKPINVDELIMRMAAAERLVHAVRVVERVKRQLRAAAGRPSA